MFGGAESKDKRAETVAAARQARQERQRAREQKERNEKEAKAAISIQCACRQHLSRKRAAEAYRERVDRALANNTSADPLAPLQLYELMRMLLRVFDVQHDRNRLSAVAKIILRGVLEAKGPDDALNSYFVLILNKAALQGWIAQVKTLIVAACDTLPLLRDRRDDHALAHTLITLILTCLDHERWKLTADPAKATVFRVIAASFLSTVDKYHLFQSLQAYLTMCLAAPRPRCQPPTLALVVALLNRVLAVPKDKDGAMDAFARTIMLVPTLASELKLAALTCKEDILRWAIHHKDDVVSILSDDGNSALFFLGNLCSIFDAQTTIKHSEAQDVVAVCLQCCLHFTKAHRKGEDNPARSPSTTTLPKAVSSSLASSSSPSPSSSLARGKSKGSEGTSASGSASAAAKTRKAPSSSKTTTTTASEHPLLGWYYGHTPRHLLDSMPRVLQQLRPLWSPAAVRARLDDVWVETERLRGEKPKDAGLQTLQRDARASSSRTDKGTRDPTTASSSATASASSSSAPSSAQQQQQKPQPQCESKTEERSGNASSSSFSKRLPWWSQRLRQVFQMTSSSSRFVDAAASVRVAQACAFYQSLYSTIKAASQEVLGALAFGTDLVPRLWTFMHHIGPKGNMGVFMAAVGAGTLEREPLIACLEVACDATRILLTVVDDTEMFSDTMPGDSSSSSSSSSSPGPFSPQHLELISAFLNRFLHSIIWQQGLTLAVMAKREQENARASALLRSCARLIRFIRDIDDRNGFTQANHWLLKEAKPRTVTAEYMKEAAANSTNERAHTLLHFLPHLLPFHERVKLLRELLDHQRQTYLAGLPQFRTDAMVKIRRQAILTDGFSEIMALGPDALRDNVRIVFINEQGLPEAGIDEKGLFKEFLEETLKSGFDPEFGLFAVTGEGNNTLFPSPSSSVHDNHLQLFDYLGRMVGKMIYDGMVVDLPLAPFFCNSILGIGNTLRDLPSFDPALARNLHFVKTYEGDVSDLGLCFAVDEEVFGHRVTIPLRPGGSAIDVTNDNRILYVHLLADYRLNKQLAKQTQAFTRGLMHMVPRPWLRLFTAPELQRLISGEDVPLDVSDLRRHAQYIGGYTAGHRMIKWLWEVVARDFSREEQQQFLRFVTACSKPPVLGFASLQPPFTIRCMNEGDREEMYTMGGVLSNFFSRGTDTARLPSASTCFNLLKLPTYRSKRTLREKLRYAISQGIGFEMA